MRPRQWVKNLLVVAAPLAAGALLQVDVLMSTALAFITFCLSASGVYLVNDVRDAESDRAHPTKRRRPIAAGELSPATAIAVGLLLLIIAPGVAVLTQHWALGAVLVTYELVQLLYSYWLKHQPIVDLAVVTSGFLLRAIAGGVAASLALSQWFLLVASFGSLFIVAGKRYSEKRLVGAAVSTRPALETYSEDYLRFVWEMAAAVTITTYALWAFELREAGPTILPVLSIAPFVLGILRYAMDIDRGAAGAPEDIAFRDRPLQVFGVVWLVLFGAAVVLR